MWITVKEARDLLDKRVSLGYLYALTKKQLFTSCRVGRKVLIDQEDFLRYIHRQTPAAPKPKPKPPVKLVFRNGRWFPD